MRKNYEEMLKLLVEKNVFKKGEIVDRSLFEKRLRELDLVEEFDKKYNYGIKDEYMMNRWYLWSFSDRFKSFMIKCKDYCKYLGNGKYEIL